MSYSAYQCSQCQFAVSLTAHEKVKIASDQNTAVDSDDPISIADLQAIWGPESANPANISAYQNAIDNPNSIELATLEGIQKLIAKWICSTP